MRTTWQPLSNETKPLTFLLVLTVLFLFTSSCSDNIQNAHDAYNKKDYKEAHKLFLSLATDGVAQAQNKLGWMYSKGQGVPQDNKEAVKWWRLAAEQGNAPAQYNLGVMYTNGQGVPKDSVSAHMWFNVAASNGNKDAVKNRNCLLYTSDAADE